MNGGGRLLAGVAAVALVVSALGLAAPSSAELNGQPVVTEVSINR
ncbi:hypothetical protein [Nocardioides sp.]|nr:hypothetical protein [Nocardioides sp.]